MKNIGIEARLSKSASPSSSNPQTRFESTNHHHLVIRPSGDRKAKIKKARWEHEDTVIT
ncbi:hypothetical protein SERLA73DRAFT_186872 [Serpula lacrymans var. lacrymans S7.3]|uniref:Uncharacterized protein n=2 Tax=Serpula lacrymans var. lacrymans TaxID=341189 RepID=F8Q805_SERL3|nr:uncharacterized protein SERLADRAFT_476141 [Serpula lacrymans var. lacrymans S7.9]EGN95693.1 hypothetical protein SERLA73DRAFT_186872 [Serpula lacrymans var. lacrymans S7.3]EGO21219.1 hypothetical protein SERLADRAFT_476141 [Serpula lacrymans var. lacrymans S7.9]